MHVENSVLLHFYVENKNQGKKLTFIKTDVFEFEYVNLIKGNIGSASKCAHSKIFVTYDMNFVSEN